jgi:altronate dehydratase
VLTNIEAGERAAADSELSAAAPIPFGHKIAIRRIRTGDAILKYGVVTGFATCDIPAGNWVHHHNMKSYFVAKREEQSS